MSCVIDEDVSVCVKSKKELANGYIYFVLVLQYDKSHVVTSYYTSGAVQCLFAIYSRTNGVLTVLHYTATNRIA